MPRKLTIATLASLAVLASAAPSLAQTRVQPKGAEDMKDILATAASQWEEGKYAECAKSLGDALALANAKRNDALLEALPAPPAGWTKVEKQPSEQLANNPLAQAMGGFMGKMVNQEYREEGGSGRLEVTLTIDSPVVNMMSMAFSNPAMLEEGSELIQYGTHKAVLKSEGGQPRELQIVLDGKNLCAVEVRGLTEEQLFEMFDQKAVDHLAATMQG